MLPLQHARQWRIASVILMILVMAATLMPAVWFFEDKVTALTWFHDADKWLHGVTFLVLALWYTGLYRRRSYWRVALGLVAFGFLIELCQLLVSYRTADWVDIVANTAGIIVGLIIGIAGAGGWCLRVENWYAVRHTGA